MPDGERRAVASAYGDHVRQLKPVLPPALYALASEVSLHDGLIRAVTLDRIACSLHLVLRCGDLDRGYFDLDLKYAAVDLENTDAGAWRSVATLQDDTGSHCAELLRDEVDAIAAGLFEHRMIFWVGRDEAGGPYREIAVRFGALEMVMTRRKSRNHGGPGGIYRELGSSDG